MNKIMISFDGGCRPTNPGNKYGSYEVSMNGKQLAMVSRMELGFGTNNEAEFEIFESALKWTVENIKAAGNSPSDFLLESFSDSSIVVGRMKLQNSRNKSEPQKRMAACADKCLLYTMLFRGFSINWNGRESNVKKFGH